MRIRYAIVNILLLFPLLFSILACAEIKADGTPPPQIMTVHFIDVGQGDAILIDYGTTEILIDGGDGIPDIVQYLHSFVDGDIEVVVATHYHADHIGGLISVLEQFNIDEIWVNADTYSSQTLTSFTNAMISENATIRQVQRGQSLPVGSISFYALNPIVPLLTDSTHINNNSIILKLSYGTTDFLFMGDAENEAESGILNLLLDIDILKVAHHGSRNSSSAPFLNVTKPEVAIYMANRNDNNNYGHPHAETITALQNIGADIYGTEVDGNILVSTNGSNYWVGSTAVQTINNLNISFTGYGTCSPLPGGYTFAKGTELQITASPSPGWHFSHWSGDASGSANPINITMNNDKNITANFAPDGTTLIGAIKQNPNTYVNQTVKLVGNYRGWETGHGSPPVTRSDWVLQDFTGSIYVTGNSMGLKYPSDNGKPLTITGTVRLKEGQPYVQVVSPRR